MKHSFYTSADSAGVAEDVSEPSDDPAGVAEDVSEPSDDPAGVAEDISEPSVTTSGVAEVISEPSVTTSGVAEAISEPSDDTSGVAEDISEPSVTTSGVAEAISEPSVTTSGVAEVISEPSDDHKFNDLNQVIRYFLQKKLTGKVGKPFVMQEAVWVHIFLLFAVITPKMHVIVQQGGVVGAIAVSVSFCTLVGKIKQKGKMKINGYFAGQSAVVQFFALLLFILGGNLIASVLGLTLFYSIHGAQASMEQYPDMLRLLQFLSAIGTFLVPSLALAWLFSRQPKDYLQIRKIKEGQTVAWVLLSMVCIVPLINLLTYWNGSLSLPEWAAPVEAWMRQQEDTMQHFTELLIYGGGFSPLLSNLIVVALTAAVTEEFLFRGALQRIIGQWTANPHVVIWIAAIIFSAFHLQFYGFIPRMLLGAYFGYLLLWSRSIWLPVCAHFFNNALSVIVMSNVSLKEYELLTGEVSEATAGALVLPAIIGTVAFLLVAWKLRKELSAGL